MPEQFYPTIVARRLAIWLPLFFILTFFISCKDAALSPDYSGWRAYAGSKDGIRYSSNDQINDENVSQLQVAWTYSSNDKDTGDRSQIQCNPIVIDGVLYGTSPRLKLFALNAATGNKNGLSILLLKTQLQKMIHMLILK